MDSLLDSLEFSEALPGARYRELHSRIVKRPIGEVWPHCLDVTAREIRTLGPLFAVRGLPATLRGKRPPKVGGSGSILDAFVGEGFILLRRDEHPSAGRAVVIFGAVGKFWSITGNAPRPFDSAQAFLDFDEAGWAKTTCRLEAIDQGDGTCRIETETWVHGTDEQSTRRFGPYWAIIRLPSGLIRRSWLAAIARRAQAQNT